MKLYVLKRNHVVAGREAIGYDEVIGFVVRAPNEVAARNFAALQSGEEGRSPWISTDYSTCDHVPEDGPEAVILLNFRAG